MADLKIIEMGTGYLHVMLCFILILPHNYPGMLKSEWIEAE